MDTTGTHSFSSFPPPCDWRAAQPISTNWELFEWSFGFILPIVCFALEPGLLGTFSPFDRLHALAYPFVGCELLLFAWWKLAPVESRLVAQGVAGALG